MGEEVAGLPEDPAVALAGSAGLGDEVEAEPIGAYLARQRRLRGIGLGELARITCIPLRSLERLESGAFDGNPDGFARGFVRTVATALGLDPDDAVSRMLPEAGPGLRRRSVPFPESSPWARVVFALLASAAILILFVEWRGAASDPSQLDGPRVFRRDAVRELARAEGLLDPAETLNLVSPPAVDAGLAASEAVPDSVDADPAGVEPLAGSVDPGSANPSAADPLPADPASPPNPAP